MRECDATILCIRKADLINRRFPRRFRGGLPQRFAEAGAAMEQLAGGRIENTKRFHFAPLLVQGSAPILRDRAKPAASEWKGQFPWQF
jgi:hypothetical protein